MFEFNVISLLFIAFYEIFFKFAVIIAAMKEIEIPENSLLSKGMVFFVGILSFVLDLLPFVLAKVFPAAGLALFICMALRIFIKEPKNRFTNMRDILALNVPLFVLLYLSFF